MTIPPDAERLLTAGQAAQHLNTSVRTVRRLIAAERLPAVRIGRLVRIRPADLAEMIAAGTN